MNQFPLGQPNLRPDLPNYPVHEQLIRVTATRVPGPSGSIGSSSAGMVIFPYLYIGAVQQMRTDALLPRDREPCLVSDIRARYNSNNIGEYQALSPGFYLGRLASNFNGLPVYEVCEWWQPSTSSVTGSLRIVEYLGLSSIENVHTIYWSDESPNPLGFSPGIFWTEFSSGIAVARLLDANQSTPIGGVSYTDQVFGGRKFFSQEASGTFGFTGIGLVTGISSTTSITTDGRGFVIEGGGSTGSTPTHQLVISLYDAAVNIDKIGYVILLATYRSDAGTTASSDQATVFGLFDGTVGTLSSQPLKIGMHAGKEAPSGRAAPVFVNVPSTGAADGSGEFFFIDNGFGLYRGVSGTGGGNDTYIGGICTALGTFPANHASRHQSGGADAIKLDDLASPDDNTDLNASTSAHGLLRKLDNDSTHFLDGQGNWVAINLSTLYYTATTSSDWAGGSPPASVQDALDRIAAALTLLGQPP